MQIKRKVAESVLEKIQTTDEGSGSVEQKIEIKGRPWWHRWIVGLLVIPIPFLDVYVDNEGGHRGLLSFSCFYSTYVLLYEISLACGYQTQETVLMSIGMLVAAIVCWIKKVKILTIVWIVLSLGGFFDVMGK